MRILLVTGRLAEEEVRKVAEGSGADVYVADVDVASFITPHHLKDMDLSGYDLVLIPGLARGDWRSLEEKKGVKIRLGPIHICDLPLVLKHIEEIELSHETPACKLLGKIKTKETLRLVESMEGGKFRIGNVEIGGRPKIVAEIVDASELSKDELIERIEYYLECGADIVDLGIPIEFDLDGVKRAVRVARDICDAISIDTFSKRAMEIGVEGGVDMVMSISWSNLDCEKILKDDLAVVAVDRDVERLEKLVERLKPKTEKVIADPILDPPLKVFESLKRYWEFRSRNPDTPMLMGIGNVTELIDADSIGINALMACIAEEIGVELLFTTEASVKTRGSIRELRIASYMAKASKIKRTHPKDLGLNLLVVKEKTRMEGKKPGGNVVEAKESEKFVRDPKGDFRIWVWKDRIVCEHEKVTIVGKNAKGILDTIIRLDLVSRLDHAGYLGRELMKAEIALRLGKNYVQDEDLRFQNI